MALANLPGDLQRAMNKLNVDAAATDEKDGESDDEIVRAFLACEPNGVQEHPSEEQLAELKAFEDAKPFQFTRQGSKKAGTKAKRKAKTHMPNVKMVCEGMCIEISCNKKQTKESFIEWIYLRNKDSPDVEGDGEVVACRKFDGSCKRACAIFKIGDEWTHLVPYSISSLGSWFKGDELTLDDDEGDWADLANWEPAEVDEYFKAKEATAQEEDDTLFSVTKQDGKLSVECSIPVTQMWARAGDYLALAKQFEDPEEDPVMVGSVAAEINTIRVYAYAATPSGEMATLCSAEKALN